MTDESDKAVVCSRFTIDKKRRLECELVTDLGLDPSTRSRPHARSAPNENAELLRCTHRIWLSRVQDEDDSQVIQVDMMEK